MRSPDAPVDAAVARAMAKWPNVPAVYGWLALDRRGNWRIKGEKIANAALREFIGRNYAADERGCWYFQNGPQRVYVNLAYTPLVVHFAADGLRDHCDRPFERCEGFVDEEGSVLVGDQRSIALLDDRDLARIADEADSLQRIMSADVPARFGFVREPQPR